MPDNRHIIARQLFNILLQGKIDGYAVQERISRLYWDKVVPALATLFDRLANPDVLVRVDYLEIDLGEIKLSQLDNELAKRLVNTLGQQLERLSATAGAKGIEEIPMSYSNFEAWLHFLEKGHLPWQSGELEEETMQNAALKTIASEISAVERFRELLRKQPYAMDRLAAQHPEPFLQQLAEAVSGQKQAHLSRLQQELQQLLTQEKQLPESVRPAGTPGVNFSQVARQFWATVFHRLARHQAHAFPAEALPDVLSGWVSPGEVQQVVETIVSLTRKKKTIYPRLVELLKKVPATRTEKPKLQSHTQPDAEQQIQKPGTDTTKQAKPDTQAGAQQEPAQPDRHDKMVSASGSDRPDRKKNIVEKPAGAKSGPEYPPETPPETTRTVQENPSLASEPSKSDPVSEKKEAKPDLTGKHAPQEQQPDAAINDPDAPPTGKTDRPNKATQQSGETADTPQKVRKPEPPQVDAIQKSTASPQEEPDTEPLVPGKKTAEGEIKTAPDKSAGDAPKQKSAQKTDTPGDRTANDQAPQAEQEPPARTTESSSETGIVQAPEQDLPAPEQPAADPEQKPLKREKKTPAKKQAASTEGPGEKLIRQTGKPQPPAGPLSEQVPPEMPPGERQTADQPGKPTETEHPAEGKMKKTKKPGKKPSDTRATEKAEPGSQHPEGYPEQQEAPPPDITAPAAVPFKPEFRPPAFQEQPTGTVYYVRNAGVSLVHPFLATYFRALGLLDGAEFVDEPSRHKAVHLIEYLATGKTGLPEYSMVLPKFLCELPLEIPLEREVEITAEELEEADNLLRAVVKHWGAIGEASPDALREGFLRREGKIERRANGWYLVVEHQTIDILLNRLPWNISMIRLPWMKELLRVEWK